jgi:D-alanyl-lipoteichoic acid acyltransferase DltB (MBOAT superfamily)
VWGLFKKIVVADNMGLLADEIFDNHTKYQGVDLLLGALAFSAQIYGDFSGYSDMARGLARTLGFELCINFKLPYLARSPREFWRRWHVSLSEWLRDYLYLTLGGNRAGRWKTVRNLMVTMLLGGLWHGAAWHFVLWGGYHGVLLVASRPFEHFSGRFQGVAFGFVRWVLVFSLIVIGWVLFRATSLEQIAYFATHVGVATSKESGTRALDVLVFCTPLIAMHALQYLRDDLLAFVHMPWLLRSIAYAAMIVGMLIFAVREPMEFIYFQF